jgi:hypothetical protein
MTGTKICLVSALGLASIDLTSVDYEKVGIVGILIVAIVVIWKDGKARQDKLENIIAENTKALSTNTEVQREIKETLKKCHEKANP